MFMLPIIDNNFYTIIRQRLLLLCGLPLSLPNMIPPKPWLWHDVHTASFHAKYNYVPWSQDLKVGYVACLKEGTFFIDNKGIIFKIWYGKNIVYDTIVRIGYNLPNTFVFLNMVTNVELANTMSALFQSPSHSDLTLILS